MKRDQAWYERHQKRVDEWRKTAREWNGHKDTSGLGNVEFVTVGGQEHEAAARCALGRIATSEATRLTSAPSREAVAGNTAGKVSGRRGFDSRTADPTIAGTPTRKDGVRETIAIAAPKAATPAAPLYPLVTLCRSMKIPEPVPEYCFAKSIGRRWRADYCWPAHMLILEVNGGVWTQGRHTRGEGAIADMEKLSEAAIMGYRVLYATPEQMHNGVALDRIIRALTDRAAA